MSLRFSVILASGILGLASWALQGFECLCGLVAIPAAVLASAYWSRGHRPYECAASAVVIIVLGTLPQLVGECPVGHKAYREGLLPCVVHSRWGALTEAWLDTETVLSDTTVHHLTSNVCIGLCCGLASVQAFAGPLAARRHARACCETAGTEKPAA